MKNFTLTAISGFALCTTPTLNAQEIEEKSPWSFGVKGGINLMDNRYEGTDLGLNLGATVEYDLGKRFFLRSGLEFTSKSAYSSEYYGNYGYYNTPALIGNSSTYEYSGKSGDKSTLFLQIPLTMGYRLPVSKDVNLTFNAGVFGGIGLASNGHYSKWNSKLTTDENGDIKDNESINEYGSLDGGGNFDFGLMGGIGVEYKKFSFNLNYEHGLINQGNKAYKNMGGDALKNKNISLSVGYKF